MVSKLELACFNAAMQKSALEMAVYDIILANYKAALFKAALNTNESVTK